MSRKKAFTLLELTIVLVLIGLILGMAIKGQDLVRSAKESANIQSLMKIEVAVNQAMQNVGGKVHKLPVQPSGGLDGASIANMLLNTNMLVKKDLLVPGGNGSEWSYTTIKLAPGANTWSDSCASSNVLCPGIGLAIYTENINEYWICRFESKLDDMQHNQGMIRSNISTLDSEVSCQESFDPDDAAVNTMYYQIF